MSKARGLANARPPGRAKFSNALPPGLTRHANAPQLPGGGWAQLELTDALCISGFLYDFRSSCTDGGTFNFGSTSMSLLNFPLLHKKEINKSTLFNESDTQQ